jgi:hypothetical protein
MSDVKISYALVSSKNMVQPNPTFIGDHVREVVSDAQGSYIVSFEDNFFKIIPTVQVTAFYNGWQDNKDLNPINTPSIPSNAHPADRLVHACVEWVTQTSCRVLTSFNDSLNNGSLSFSITAIGY